MIPVDAAPEEATAVRTFLQESGFTERVLCDRLGIPDIYHFAPVFLGRPPLTGTRDAVDLLIRLFLDSEAVEPATVERFIPAKVLTAMRGLGLLRSGEGSTVEATVLLYPTESLYIVSDQPRGPATGESAVSDAVYPAVTLSAKHFVTAIPRSSVERLLELCSGTGIGALVASRTAGQAWAVDITERSTRFARFNAVLNGIDRVTALQGDLYEPVAGRTFDRILAHPPYVQSTETREIYRDGGVDGERLTRAVIQGLPDHLAPGGQLYCQCTLADREGASLEERVRDWLGSASGQFDVFIFTLGTLDPYRALYDEALRGRTTLEETRRREAIYRDMSIQELVYCTLVIQRVRAARPVMNVRRLRGEETDGDALEWLMRWETASRGAAAEDPLDGAVVTVSPHVRSVWGRTLSGGRWVTEHTTLETEWPFPNRIQCAPWLVDYLESCDGSRTVQEDFRALRDAGILAADVTETAFGTLIQSLVAAGVLLLPTFPLPPRPGHVPTGE